MSNLSGKQIVLQQDDRVGTILINNPERRNAISLKMWRDLRAAAQALAAADRLRVAVIRGAGGKAFASGADISEFDTQRDGVGAVMAYDHAVAAACESIGLLEIPTIALIEGYCVGGGLALALCCDLRLASDDAQFAIPAARLGLAYRYDMVARLVSVVGPAQAKEILFTGRLFDANQALRMGLVNQVSPAPVMGAMLDESLETIAANAPLTLAAAKHAVAETMKDPGQRDMARMAELEAACIASDDYLEGRRAFEEKRPPKFVGR